MKAKSKLCLVGLIFFLCLGISNTTVHAAGIGITYEEQFSETLAPVVAKMFGDEITDEIQQEDIDALTEISFDSLSKVSDLDGLEIFVNLEEVSVSFSQLTKFPDNLKALPKLKSLTFFACGLGMVPLPDSWAEFTSLETLDFANGLTRANITEVLDFLQTIPNLKNLDISKNGFRSITPENEEIIRSWTNVKASQSTGVVTSAKITKIGGESVVFDDFPLLGQSRDYSVPLDIEYTLEDPDGNVASFTPTFDDEGKVVIANEMFTKAGDYRFEAYVQDATGVFDGALAYYEFSVDGADENPITLTLNGEASMEMNVGDTFNDPGAIAIDTKGSLEIAVSGTVDTSTPGTYTISYTATNAYETKTITREVIVKEIEEPILPEEPVQPIPEATEVPQTSDYLTSAWGILLGISGMIGIYTIIKYRKNNN